MKFIKINRKKMYKIYHLCLVFKLASFLIADSCDDTVFRSNPDESNGTATCKKMLANNFKIEGCLNIIFSSKISSYKIIIKSFQKFNQIDFSCINSSEIAFIFTFIPTNKLILDNSLSFQLSEPQKSLAINLIPEIISLKFVFVKGFELNSSVFSILLRFYDQILVTFYYSSFSVFSKAKKITNCTAERHNQTIFAQIFTLQFAFTTKYYQDTCSLIFQNSLITNLLLYGLSDVFIKRNMLGFIKMKRNINVNINFLSLYFYRINLDENLLDETVFSNIKILYLSGRLTGLGKNIFQYCNQLLVLIINLENLEIIIYNDIWLKSLTSKHSKVIVFRIDEKSKFENSSLCLFEKVFNANNISVYFFWTQEPCNCEKIWFYVNSTFTSSFIKIFFIENAIDYIVPTCIFDCVESSRKIDTRHFAFKSNCTNYSSKPNIYLSDLLYKYEIINFILIVSIPIISFLGFSTNLLNIVILLQILKKNKLDSHNYLEKTMLVNSIINFSYFVIYSIHLMNKCVYYNGIFCSKLNHIYAVQLFEIIFYDFFLNVLKYMSNISLIILSITRLYLLLKKNLNFLFKHLKTAFFITFFFSCMISIDKFFTSKINFNYLALEDSEYEEFPIKNSFQFWVFRERIVTYFGTKAFIFYVFFIVNFLLNDVLLIIILGIIDFLIIYFFRKNTNAKNKALRNMELLNKFTNLEENQVRITSVILINIFILLTLKMIHFVFSTKILYEKLKSILNESLCIYQGRICTIYQEIGEVFYSISNIYTIVLFYYLNKKYRQLMLKIINYVSLIFLKLF